MKSFPTKTLLFAPLPLWLVIAGQKVLSASGVYWNVHGNIILLGLAVLAALLFDVAVEVYAIYRALAVWRNRPASRTKANYVVFALALVQIALLAAVLIWWGQQPANPHL